MAKINVILAYTVFTEPLRAPMSALTVVRLFNSWSLEPDTVSAARLDSGFLFVCVCVCVCVSVCVCVCV